MKRIEWNAPVTLGFAGLSLIALLLSQWFPGINYEFFSIHRSSFMDPLLYLRCFSHVLGHSSVQHYVNNMMLFLILCPMVEERYGAKLLIEMMAVTAVLTAILWLIFGSGSLLGASGIVFMLILLASITGKDKGTLPVTLILVAICYLGSEIQKGLTARDHISQMAHITGGVVGIFYGLTMRHAKKRS